MSARLYVKPCTIANCSNCNCRSRQGQAFVTFCLTWCGWGIRVSDPYRRIPAPVPPPRPR